jgi:hypothetical protein
MIVLNEYKLYKKTLDNMKYNGYIKIDSKLTNTFVSHVIVNLPTLWHTLLDNFREQPLHTINSTMR